MSSDLFRANVGVHPSGYEWVVGQGSSGSSFQIYLTPCEIFEEMRLHNPLTEATGLFRDFAQVDMSKEGILTFANEYGRLQALEERILVRTKTRDKQAIKYGDHMSDWCQSIGCMRLAVSLWDMVRANDLEGLSRYVNWRGVQLVFRSDPDLPGDEDAHWFPWCNLGEELCPEFEPGDLVGPAKRVMAYCLYQNLGSNAFLDMDPLGAEIDIYINITGLQDIVWFQFAQAVMGDREYRQCRTCGKWYELHPDTARTNRLSCSDACRSKAYRQRKIEARRLFAEGIAVNEIARRLDTDPGTAQTWISSPRRRAGAK